MEHIIIYLIYILALVGVVFLFLFFRERLERIKYKHDILKFLVDKGYETEHIDLNNYLK